MLMTRKILSNFANLLLVLLLTVGLAGCGGISGDSLAGDGTFKDTTPGAGVGGNAAVGAQKVFAANGGGGISSAEDYRIAPLDVLDIAVFGVQDLNRSVQVSSSGQISLPLINTVRAGGKTPNQLEKDIANKLSATYLQSPQVSVYVKEYNSQKITVDGAVNKPGIYPIAGRMSLLQAVALAEGLNTVADSSGILIFRTVDNKRLAARFDLKQVRSGKIPDPFLKAGDIVMVDESAARTTLRDVKDALPLSGLFQLLAL
jgi:polysaccharide biosynthesis/export protein